MAAEVLEHAPPATTTDKPELIAFRQQEAAIAELADKYMGLTIAGPDDKKGFDAVHSARMVVKGKRVAVEKRRKELKADALEYGRLVDAAAKALAELLEPIEAHLEGQENIVLEERKRKEREAEEGRQAKLRARVDALAAVGATGNVLALAEQPDAEFERSLADATSAFQERQRIEAELKQREAAAAAERARLEAEAAEKRKAEEAALAAERERLAAITRQQEAERAKQEAEATERRKAEEKKLAEERERLAEVQRRQEAEAAKLASEKQRIADEEAARQRAIEMEKAKAEAAEKARIEAERRHAEQLAREKAEAEAKAAREKQEAADREAARIKAERERPQREKLLSLAGQVESLDVPAGPGSKAARDVLTGAARHIRAIAKGPLDTPAQERQPA